MTAYSLPDGRRTVTFDGVLLADATTDDGRNLRWTDAALYRTVGGSYVLHEVGRSSVYHTPEHAGPECVRLGDAWVEGPWSEGDVDLEACPVCEPGDLTDDVMLESDRSGVKVAGSAAALVTLAHVRDRRNDGARFVPRAATLVLDAAAEIDPDVKQAWTVTVIP